MGTSCCCCLQRCRWDGVAIGTLRNQGCWDAKVYLRCCIERERDGEMPFFRDLEDIMSYFTSPICLCSWIGCGLNRSQEIWWPQKRHSAGLGTPQWKAIEFENDVLTRNVQKGDESPFRTTRSIIFTFYKEN